MMMSAGVPLPDSYSPYQHHQQQQQQHHHLNLNLNQDLDLDMTNTIATDNAALMEVLKNSHISACTDVQTLDSTPSLVTDENGLSSNGFIHSILTRRLGLIVGCCLGIIVFIVMISVLSYVKLKKQRIENAKRQAALPPEYISYRHFSIPNEELTRTAANAATAAAAAAQAAAAAAAASSSSANSNAGSSPHMSSVPSGISAHISGTSLSTGTGTGTTNTTTATTPIGGVPILGGGGTVVVPLGKAGSPLVGLVVDEQQHGPGHNHNHTGHAHAHAHAAVAHRQNNGYMAAGVVLNTNHLSVC